MALAYNRDRCKATEEKSRTVSEHIQSIDLREGRQQCTAEKGKAINKGYWEN